VCFFDTTLRDGEQMPGVSFDREQRLTIARALDEIGVDDIEIGFAASGKQQREDMAAVVDLGLRARTISLARPLASDIELARQTGVHGVNIFTPGSEQHLRHKLRRSFEDAIELMQAGLRFARDAGLFVCASFEDATRTTDDRLAIMARAAVSAGAQRISIADTVGCATPALISQKIRTIRGVCDASISVHLHNDFGLAVANAMAAVDAGARWLSTTVNGIGERSGNAAMEECALALVVLGNHRCALELGKLTGLCRLVAEASGVPLPLNKPIVGGNSFRHESGIHVAAVLNDPSTYEAYDPALVGATRELVLGKTSGRKALRHLAGVDTAPLDDADAERVLQEIARRSDQRGLFRADTVTALVAEVLSRRNDGT
jgi:isopropylmalate/homocitrate/citramalate synthase